MKNSNLNPIELVNYISSQGFFLYVEDGDLVIDPSDAENLSLEQKQFIERNKTKLMLGSLEKELKFSLGQVDRFITQIIEKDHEINLLRDKYSLNPQLLKHIKQLVHPDKHNNSDLSTKTFAEVSKL